MLLELQRKNNDAFRAFRKVLDTSMDLAIMLIQLDPKEGTAEAEFLLGMAIAIEKYEMATLPKPFGNKEP
jgi:hypothetical protein